VEELDAHQKSRRPAAGRQRASVILDDMCLAGSRGSNREEQGVGGEGDGRAGCGRESSHAGIANSEKQQAGVPGQAGGWPTESRQAEGRRRWQAGGAGAVRVLAG
jgi:hypothetical protein